MPQQPLSQVPADATWDWQEVGSCREADPELFFHPQNERGLARLRRDRARVARLIANGAQVLVCGGREMAAGVAEAMTDILAPQGLTPAKLKAEGRYAEDVY